MDIKKILVPLDFSDLGANALHSAARLAKLYGGRITPFHSYLPVSEMETPYDYGMSAGHTEDFEETEQVLSERLAELAGEAIDDSLLTEPVITIGNPAQSIVEEADAYDAVAMSTHGRTGFSRFFLGSVSEKVLRTSHKPVLIVNRDRQLSGLNRIMVTTDFSDNARAAFEYALDIARRSGATLELVHILSYDPQYEDAPGEKTRSLREQRLEVLGKEELHEMEDQLETRLIVSSDSPHEAILNQELNGEYDLIVMSTVGRTGIKYLMMGSTTANVVRHVNCPVLSINPKITSAEEIQ